MSTETIEIEVKPEHRKLAKKNRERNAFYLPCGSCMVSLAIKDVHPVYVSCGSSDVLVDGVLYSICDTGRKLIDLFDAENYDEIHLPQTITLTRCE